MTHTCSDAAHTETPPARVQELMTPAPLAISPETSVQDLRLVLPSPATSLAAHEVHSLLERLTVAEVMTRFPVTIGSDHPVTEAASRMLSHKVHALPVTEHRRLVGILTRTHLLSAFVWSQAAQPLAA